MAGMDVGVDESGVVSVEVGVNLVDGLRSDTKIYLY